MEPPPTCIKTENLEKIDAFIKSAIIVAFKKRIQNVGYVSCFYSLNFSFNEIHDFIFVNEEFPTRLLVPIVDKTRIVLAVFFSEDNRIEYYDSLKEDFCPNFHGIKDAVERYVGLKFNLTNQIRVNESINENPMPSLANVHICRIAEELCFNYDCEILENFNIFEEGKRIRRILGFVSTEKWADEWIFSGSSRQSKNAKKRRRKADMEKRFENIPAKKGNYSNFCAITEMSNAIQKMPEIIFLDEIPSSGQTSEICIIKEAATNSILHGQKVNSIHEEIDQSTSNLNNSLNSNRAQGIPEILSSAKNATIIRDQQIDIVIDDVINIAKTLTSPYGSPQIEKENPNMAIIIQRLKEKRAQIQQEDYSNQAKQNTPINMFRLNITKNISHFQKMSADLLKTSSEKFPILHSMLQVYTNLTILRNARNSSSSFSSNTEDFTVLNYFNWKVYSDLNSFEKESGTLLFLNFPFFKDLPESDRILLLQRFWSPFWFFERAFDTSNSIQDSDFFNLIILQNRSCYNLEKLTNENSTWVNRSQWIKIEKIVFGFWISMLPKFRKINPKIMEVMYIFCNFLWNLDVSPSLSEAGEDIVRRGRLILNKEMREFYEFDDCKWQRIFEIRQLLFMTESSVKEYKSIL